MPKLHEEKVNVLKKPEWLKIRLHRTAEYADVQRIVRDHSLHTICSSGLCPNKAECWSRRTATFMILGEICTRNCRFCATLSGRPLPPDPSEPAKLAESVRLMGLRHVVVTSVTRDDLPDGGAAHWAECVRAIRAENPDVTIELLIPDLDAKPDLLDTVIASGPDIIGHNIETTERLTPLVRSRARYRTSLDVLRYLSEKGAVAKSGLMVGLGESDEEVFRPCATCTPPAWRSLPSASTFVPLWSITPLRRTLLPKNSTGTGSRRSTWASATARAVRWCVRRTWRTKRSARCV